MIRHIHHPSCPAGHDLDGACICPPAKRTRRRPLGVAAEAIAFAAMVAAVAAFPLYVLWRAVA